MGSHFSPRAINGYSSLCSDYNRTTLALSRAMLLYLHFSYLYSSISSYHSRIKGQMRIFRNREASRIDKILGGQANFIVNLGRKVRVII